MWIYIWLAITVVALIIEFITSDMISVWFAGGGVVSMILAACGVEWYIHLPVFIVLSLVLMLAFRKMVLKYFNRGDSRTNADSAIGKDFELLSEISFNNPGTIKINDVIWGAVTENAKDFVQKGTIVTVKGLKGNKYIVEEKK